MTFVTKKLMFVNTYVSTHILKIYLAYNCRGYFETNIWYLGIVYKILNEGKSQTSSIDDDIDIVD